MMLDVNEFTHKSTVNGLLRLRSLRRKVLFVSLVRVLVVLVSSIPAYGQSTAAPNARNRVTLNVYIRPDSDRCSAVCDFLDQLKKRRRGLIVVVHDVAADVNARRDLYALGDRYNVKKLGLPAVHVLNRFRVGYSDTTAGQKDLESLLTVEVFTRSTCPRCRDAKVFLQNLAYRWPAIRFDIRDINTDSAANDRMMELAKHYRVNASSVPAFHLCGKLKIGYLGPRTTGAELESMIRKAARSDVNSHNKELSRKDAQRLSPETKSGQASFGRNRDGPPDLLPQPVSANRNRGIQPNPRRVLLRGFFSLKEVSPVAISPAVISVATLNRSHGFFDSDWFERGPLSRQFAVSPVPQDANESAQMDSIPELTPDQADSLDGLPNLPDSETSDSELPTSESSNEDQGMEVPLLGRLNARSLGMPVFTFLVGLVDGFNPCAMWVLMFLLSVLVNIRERKKILVIAGTFVFVSGLAYYAFMAAWLNVFMLVGMDRPAQIILGSLATVIGVINVKDFFAFGEGVSLKIPESAKPGLYARVRKIVAAKHLWAALAGAITLAVLVNIIELLCTAGLPAMYTEILMLQGYSPPVNYMYLGLYIVAYMLDDSLMVAVVVATLSKKKLQESEGRWLKLISGIVILALGVVMIFKPELLV